MDHMVHASASALLMVVHVWSPSHRASSAGVDDTERRRSPAHGRVVRLSEASAPAHGSGRAVDCRRGKSRFCLWCGRCGMGQAYRPHKLGLEPRYAPCCSAMSASWSVAVAHSLGTGSCSQLARHGPGSSAHSSLVWATCRQHRWRGGGPPCQPCHVRALKVATRRANRLPLLCTRGQPSHGRLE